MKLMVYLSIFGVILVDQLSKYFIVGAARNSMKYTGVLESADPTFVMTFHSLLVVTLVPLFLSGLYYLPKKFTSLKTVISIFLGAIISNTIDKLMYGHAVEIVSFSSFGINIADVTSIVAFIAMVAMMYKNREELFTRNAKRTSKFVNYRFQMKLILVNFALMACLFISLIVFTYIFLKGITYDLPADYFSSENLMTGLLIALLIFINFCFLSFFILKKFGQGIAGPIYALDRYAHNKASVESRLVLREHDEFKDEIMRIAQKLNREE